MFICFSISTRRFTVAWRPRTGESGARAMRHIRKVIPAILLIMTVLWAACAFAAPAKVTGLSVTAHPGNDRYLCLSFDFEANGREYTAFVAGIRGSADPSLWAEDLAQKIADCAAEGGKLRVVSRATGKANEYTVSGIDLMDAEKQNKQPIPERKSGEAPDFQSDSWLCWAAAATNSLELSGWGRAVTEMNPGKVSFENEDDIFDYFTENYTDSGSFAFEGDKWFLNGIDVDQWYDESIGEVRFGMAYWTGAQLMEKNSGGLAKAFCADDVVEWNYDSVFYGYRIFITPEGLRQAADDLAAGYGVGMGLEYGLGSGHDLTLTGTVREKTAAGAGNVVYVLLADSDNDAAEYDYDDPDAPGKAGSRRDRVNSFEMYPVVYSDSETAPGLTVAYVHDYWMHPRDDMEITNIMSVRPYSADIPKETEGTRDIYASPDLAVYDIRVGENNDRYAQTVTGEKVMMSGMLRNQSYVPLTDQPWAAIRLRYVISKDGKEYDSVTKEALWKDKQLYPLARGSDDTEIGYTFSEPGAYEIAVEILGVRDANGPVREAYTRNNKLNYAKVTVTQNEQPPLPPTGDESRLLLWVILLACSVAVSVAVTVPAISRRRR